MTSSREYYKNLQDLDLPSHLDACTFFYETCTFCENMHIFHDMRTYIVTPNVTHIGSSLSSKCYYILPKSSTNASSSSLPYGQKQSQSMCLTPQDACKKGFPTNVHESSDWCLKWWWWEVGGGASSSIHAFTSWIIPYQNPFCIKSQCG